MSPKDGQPSREAVLAAAEDLFAHQGYALSSLHQIGEAAGVSRGLPSYLFGSKEALYDAVVARVFERAHEALRAASKQATAQEPAAALEELIAKCLDFLATDPNFVNIVQRDTLRGGNPVRGALEGPMLDDALARIQTIAESLDLDSAHLLLVLVSVCWFPYAHADTLANVLGLDPYAPRFREQHRRSILELWLAAHPRSFARGEKA